MMIDSGKLKSFFRSFSILQYIVFIFMTSGLVLMYIDFVQHPPEHSIDFLIVAILSIVWIVMFVTAFEK